MPTKKEQAVDAAIDVLGTRGARGLTHRAVDERAAIPSGTTSNYFRTREALLSGVMTRLVERDRADWNLLATMPVPATVAEIVDGITAWVLHALGPDRVRTAARYALFLESAHDVALQAPLAQARVDLVEWATNLLAGLAPERSVAVLLMDYIEGVILHQLSMPATEFEPRPGIERMVSALLRG